MRLNLIAATIACRLVAAPPGRAADPPPAPVVGAVYTATDAGADARHAIATALDIVNGAHERLPVLMGQGGGLDRLGGAKLAIAFADDQGDPAQAAAAAERLVTEQHAAALIGGMTDATAAAISRVAEAHGLPFLALDSSLTNTEGLAWFFRIGRTPATDARSLLRLLGGFAAAHGKPLEAAALLFEDSPAGRAHTAPLRKAADAAGIRLVDAPASGSEPAVAAIVQTIAVAAPGAVLSVWNGPGEAAVLAALAAAGIGPAVLLRPGDASPAVDGVFRSISYVAGSLPARPGVASVATAYQARAGKPLDALTAREITGVLLLADVINRAASTKPIDLRTALMATDTPGSDILMLWDGIRFDDSGQNVLATPALQQRQQGDFQLVAPESLAAAPPIWPTPR